PHVLFIGDVVEEGLPRNELGWEIYPEGIARMLQSIEKRYGSLPVRITENGMPGTDEKARTAFLHDHLTVLAEAMADGAPVDGYYHWSFMDNFEWAEGYTARFGLVEVDFTNMNRKIRPSATVLTQIMKKGVI